MRPTTVLIVIMTGIVVWGIYHAIGAYGFNGNPWRSVVVLACSLGFIGSWLLLLANRRARLARNHTDDKGA
jgi:hypothetical protein